MKINQKSPVTSVRLSHRERNIIKRVYGMNLSEFLRTCLEIAENNNYIKNKIKEGPKIEPQK